MDNNAYVFPNNLLGTNSVNFVSESNYVFICGDYHGRYEDDDCEFFVYNKSSKEFDVLYWSTRGYCDTDMFARPMVDINCADDSLIKEIVEALKMCAIKRKKEIISKIESILRSRYPKKYSQKSIISSLSKIDEEFETIIKENNDFKQLMSLVYNSPYRGYDTSLFFGEFISFLLARADIKIKDKLNRKKKPTKVYGDDYIGEVVSSKELSTRFGIAFKVGIKQSNSDKSVWAIISTRHKKPVFGEIITLNGIVEYETERSITLSKAKRIDGIDESEIIRC